MRKWYFYFHSLTSLFPLFGLYLTFYIFILLKISIYNQELVISTKFGLYNYVFRRKSKNWPKKLIKKMFLYSQKRNKNLHFEHKKINFSKSARRIFKFNSSKWSVRNVLLGYVKTFHVNAQGELKNFGSTVRQLSWIRNYILLKSTRTSSPPIFFLFSLPLKKMVNKERKILVTFDEVSGYFNAFQKFSGFGVTILLLP